MFSSWLMQGCSPAQDRNLAEGFKGRKNPNPQKTGMSSETTGTPSVASKTSEFQHLSCGNMWKTSQKRTGIRTNRKVSNSCHWYEMMPSCQKWGQSVCTAPWWRLLQWIISQQGELAKTRIAQTSVIKLILFMSKCVLGHGRSSDG